MYEPLIRVGVINMSFKIWGRSEILNESELENKLQKMGDPDACSTIETVMRKGYITICGMKILALKY